MIEDEENQTISSSTLNTSEIQKQINRVMEQMNKAIDQAKKSTDHMEKVMRSAQELNNVFQPKKPKRQFDLCWWHYQFGADSRKCKKPCNFNKSNPNVGAIHRKSQ